MRREIERGLIDQLSKFKDKFELSFKNKQKALQAQTELLKSENSSLKLQLHKLEGNTFNIKEQANSPKILLDNKEIKNALKTITETQENLTQSVNTQRDDSSIISNKIKTVEEEIGKNQVKINEHIDWKRKLNTPSRNFGSSWKVPTLKINGTKSGKKEKLLTSKNNRTIFHQNI